MPGLRRLPEHVVTDPEDPDREITRAEWAEAYDLACAEQTEEVLREHEARRAREVP